MLWVHPGRGGFAHLAYSDSGYRGIQLVIDRQKTVIGRDAAKAAKASTISLQSLGTCSSFHTEKLARRCLTRVTYFAIRGSLDSYSAFTYPTTNWESLLIISLSTDIAAANSIPARMASYSEARPDSLLDIVST